MQNICDIESEGEMEEVRLDERRVTSAVDDESCNTVLKEAMDNNVDNHEDEKVIDPWNEDDHSLKEEQVG